jgi:hypothetical protein
MAWRPILDDPAATRAHAWLDRICSALSEPDPRDPTLDGTACRALLLGYRELAAPGGGHGEIAERLLGRAADALGEAALPPALWEGFTGTAWVIEHFERRIYAGAVDGTPDSDDALAPIDAALETLLGQTPWRGKHDVIGGLVGYAVYALARAWTPAGRRCAELIVDRLGELAIEEGPLLSWSTPARHLVPAHAAKHPEGRRDTGLAHGAAGVVAFLAAAARTGIRPGEVERLARGAVGWLLAQRRSGEPSEFPPWVSPTEPRLRARTAWCYGDPGISIALLQAAAAFDRADWRDAAIAVGSAAATRAPAACGVVDAGLCHGAAGLGHIWNRFYQATGVTLFRDAACRWFEVALGMEVEGGAGVVSADFDADGHSVMRPDPSLLGGAAGIGLTLLAATTEIAPDWDRVFLLSS